ncbi:MAG: hypothetical protein RTU92_10940, partial [Candidatus Thorarchaeota archaeon]
MKEGCPSGRKCESCPYESMCGGCLEGSCVHVRTKESGVDRKEARCLFCELNSISCSTHNPPPPTDIPLADPQMLDDAITAYVQSDFPDSWRNPPEPSWPLLIPEVSDVTDTTSRLGVWPDEGDWINPFFDPIAWDMNGYLFDKIRGASWVSEPTDCSQKDWHDILGPEKNWINNILLIDRLPDRLAMQTPPTGIMVAYLNRLMSHHSKMLYDDDAPYPWLVTHGYPSYIDWPPAWHFNLGIRMISSLLSYLSSQDEGVVTIGPGALYPDKSRQTTTYLPLPYVSSTEGNRLLFEPNSKIPSPVNMEWPKFPGIIPFVPGADTNQIVWFGKKLIEAGFNVLALDAMNTIAHENFRGLSATVDTLRSAGTKRVLVYGPWPLHIPSDHRPIHGVSYIPSASHMDLTDYPSRFWRISDENSKEQSKWEELPSYKTTGLGVAASNESIETCDCTACDGAKLSEPNPRGIWRFGHLLLAGFDWVIRVQNKEEEAAKITENNERLWYQGPSYMVFRRSLNLQEKSQCESKVKLIESLEFRNDRMGVVFPDGFVATVQDIRWGSKLDLYKWAT